MKYLISFIMIIIAGCGHEEARPRVRRLLLSSFNIAKNCDINEALGFHESASPIHDAFVMSMQEVMSDCIPEDLDISIYEKKEGASIHTDLNGNRYFNLFTDIQGVSEKRKTQPAIESIINGEVFIFISVHFQAYDRELAYKQVVDMVRTIGGYSYDHLVVMGDFNLAKDGCVEPIGCDSGSDDGYYYSLAKSEMESIGLRLIGDHDGGCWNYGLCTKGTTHTLDYIFASEDIKLVDFNVTNADGISDHNLVQAVIEM